MSGLPAHNAHQGASPAHQYQGRPLFIKTAENYQGGGPDQYVRQFGVSSAHQYQGRPLNNETAEKYQSCPLDNETAE